MASRLNTANNGKYLNTNKYKNQCRRHPMLRMQRELEQSFNTIEIKNMPLLKHSSFRNCPQYIVHHTSNIVHKAGFVRNLMMEV